MQGNRRVPQEEDICVRRSYAYYSNVDAAFLVSKFLFTSSSLSAFVFVPLAALSLGAAVIEVLEKPLKIAQRKEEYRFAYKFYQELINLYKSGELNEHDVNKRELEFVKSMNFFPREKYIRETRLNGYKYSMRK